VFIVVVAVAIYLLRKPIRKRLQKKGPDA